MAIVSVVSIVGLIPWELNHPQPAVDLRLFKNRSFAAASSVMFIFGFILISTTQLLPQLTQQLMGYDATTAGMTLGMGGLAALFMVPVAGQLGSRGVQPKYLIIMAFLGSGAALMHLSSLDISMSFWSVSWARVFQSVFLPFLFVSITAASYTGIAPDKTNEASAIVNLMRNLGGSVGVSAATTILAWQTQRHHARLAESVSPLSRHFGIYLNQSGMSGDAAIRGIAGIVQAQSSILSYLDIFWLWGIGAFLVWPIGLLIRNIPKGQEARG
jgi:DHA2 family multidrug resistance protein